MAAALEISDRPGLTLADGSGWELAGADPWSSKVVSRCAEIGRLSPSPAPSTRIVVTGDRRAWEAAERSSHLGFVRFARLSDGALPVPALPAPVRSLIARSRETVVCFLNPDQKGGHLNRDAMEVLNVIAFFAQANEGFLLHGALADHRGDGVVLAGRSGVGKTTASRRLPAPWRTLCDDTTLVVRDGQDVWHAHPWPTWGRIVFNRKNRAGAIAESVPLVRVFILDHAPGDRVDPLGAGEGLCLLTEASEQVSWPLTNNLPDEEVRALRLRRFENLTALANAVPCHRLSLSLKGRFWKEIEGLLTGDSRRSVCAAS